MIISRIIIIIIINYGRKQDIRVAFGHSVRRPRGERDKSEIISHTKEWAEVEMHGAADEEEMARRKCNSRDLLCAV